MAIPDYQTLMLPLLAAAAVETSVPEVAERIAEHFRLSEDERSQMRPGGRQTILQNRLHWAKLYLTRAGLLDRPRRGRFIASDSGRQLLSQNLSRIDNNFLDQYPGFREFRLGEQSSSEEAAPPTPVLQDSATPEEQIDEAYGALQATLRSNLLKRVLDNSPEFFEAVIVDLLVAMGYGGSHQNAAQRLGRTGDGGVDGIINEDRLGLDRIYVQAKRWAVDHSVGRPDVQGFLGSLVGRGATKGVFVTTSNFSAQAKDFVNNLTQRIVLIDGRQLADLMIEHNVGVRVHRTVEFKRVDEDFFAEED
jgi:restriction system protein